MAKNHYVTKQNSSYCVAYEEGEHLVYAAYISDYDSRLTKDQRDERSKQLAESVCYVFNNPQMVEEHALFLEREDAGDWTWEVQKLTFTGWCQDGHTSEQRDSAKKELLRSRDAAFEAERRAGTAVLEYREEKGNG